MKLSFFYRPYRLLSHKLSYRRLAAVSALAACMAASGFLASASPLSKDKDKEKEHEGKNVDSGS
ncbi:MAG: hypothetical protein WCC19_10425, partial [Terriglobales bacterium]